MNNKWRISVSMSIAALYPFAASEIACGEPTIGALVPLTGELAQFGSIVRGGIESAHEGHANVLYEDDSCLPERSVSAYMKLSSVSGVKLFLGPCCTSAMAAVAPLLKKNQHVTMNFCTGSEDIYAASGGNVFHSQYSAQADAEFNARAMWDLGVRKPVVIYQESEFGIAHDAAFKRAFPGRVIKTLTYSGADRGQLKSLVLSLKNIDSDALYVPLVETFLLGLMTEMKKANVTGKRVFGIYSVQLPAVLEAEGENANGIIYSYPDIPMDENAAVYFARTAAEMLEKAGAKCGDDVECVKGALKADYDFDTTNFLRRRLFLKTIRNVQFVEFKPQ